MELSRDLKDQLCVDLVDWIIYRGSVDSCGYALCRAEIRAGQTVVRIRGVSGKSKVVYCDYNCFELDCLGADDIDTLFDPADCEIEVAEENDIVVAGLTVFEGAVSSSGRLRRRRMGH